MTFRRYFPLLAVALAALAACASTGAGAPADQAAASSGTAQPDEPRLASAEAAADGGDLGLCARLIDPVAPATLNTDQQLRWHILKARIALAAGNPRVAVEQLPANPPDSPAAERALLWRGRALFQAGDAVAATQTLVARERRLQDPAAIEDNRKELWTGLSAATLDPATLERAGSADRVSRGWIELANLARHAPSREFYDAWSQRYHQHPAETRLSELMPPPAPVQAVPAPAPSPPAPAEQAAPVNPAAPVLARPGFLALLLPQSGALAARGEAVHQGFAEALARAASSTEVRVYDTGATPSQALDAYGHAVSDGAGLVVGPLLKDSVAALAQVAPLNVPVIALNYLDAGHPAPAGLYQFGLAPEDEARAAAEDAAARGLRRALVMVGDNERGERMLAAFSQRLSELGGRVVDTGRYGGEPKTWAEPVSALLHYRLVEDRKKAAELRAHARPGVDPQRRNDFDFIFIDAKAGQARLLWPLFRYYHAERIPIYDTAAVNEGNGDQDLAAIRFCDAPWLLDPSPTGLSMRGDATANGRGPELARLYELGADAYELAQRLSQNSLHPLDAVPGGTGTLHVGDDGGVRRELICAQMTWGEPRVLEPPSGPLPAP